MRKSQINNWKKDPDSYVVESWIFLDFLIDVFFLYNKKPLTWKKL